LNAGVEVKPLPGLEHLPYAEVWLHAPDEEVWHQASAAARALGKNGLEVWTTDSTPDVAPFLERRGYAVHRRYLISELDRAGARDPEPPAVPLTTLADRPDLVSALYALALDCYPDQPGRSETRLPDLDGWRAWGLDPHDPTAYFIAVDGDRVRAYGYLEIDGETGKHGFMAVARDARGHGLAGAIKRAQIAWAKARGLRTLRTANELRLEQMIALNRKLGYQPLYTELVLRGPAADETK
jgi:GNAT superfamily N-acetyltransferase